jgi:hypothetical protein
MLITPSHKSIAAREKENKYSMGSFTHWYAYQKRLILGGKGVQMPGIEYYTDI